jgi:DNA polymerase zeta
LELLEDTDLIGRTAEFARVFGVDFYSVISRGSQFKVESVMARIAKPRNFVMFSPSKKQVANQRAAEALPLILEPESAFYPDPLVVVDFQSLYPSVMIAYNYWFVHCIAGSFLLLPFLLPAQLLYLSRTDRKCRQTSPIRCILA